MWVSELVRRRNFLRLLLLLRLNRVRTIVRLTNLSALEDHLVGLAKAECSLLLLRLGLITVSISNARVARVVSRRASSAVVEQV